METVNIVAYPYLKTNIRVDKIGKIAIMQYISDLVQLPTGETLLATLPDGFKPINVFLTTAHQGANVQITVMPDGRILAYNYTGAAITKAVTCRFSLPYITKNEY